MEERTPQDGGAVSGEAGCRVFLVEGDARGRESDRKNLEASGFVENVRCFASSLELLSYMEAEGFTDRSVLCLTPTLIVIALGVFEDGAVVEQLKADPFLHDIPILVIPQGAADVRRAREMQADGVLHKPLGPGCLKNHAGHAWQWPTREMWMR